jgi:hypothetical protein
VARDGRVTAALVAAGFGLVFLFLVVDRRVGVAVLPPSVFGPGPLKWIYLTLGVLMSATMVDLYVPLFGQRLAVSTQYWVWLDTSTANVQSAGPFTLQVDLAASAPNDVCSTATVLAANTSVAGSTLAANPDYSNGNIYTDAGCSLFALNGADVVYRYTTMTAGPVTVTVRPQRGYDVALAVMEKDCNVGSCKTTLDAVSTHEAESYSFYGTAMTDYYFIVDSYTQALDRGRGGFIISVQ